MNKQQISRTNGHECLQKIYEFSLLKKQQGTTHNNQSQLL